MMLIEQNRKKSLTNKLKGLSAAVVLGLTLVTAIPTTSFAKNEEKPKFEFGLVSDAQYCDCDSSGTRFYR